MNIGDKVKVHTHWVKNIIGFEGIVTGFNGEWIELLATNNGLPIKTAGKVKNVLSWKIGNKLSVKQKQINII